MSPAGTAPDAARARLIGWALMTGCTAIMLGFYQMDWWIGGLVVMGAVAMPGAMFSLTQRARSRPWAFFAAYLLLFTVPLLVSVLPQTTIRIIGTARVPVTDLRPDPALGIMFTETAHHTSGNAPMRSTTRFDLAPLAGPQIDPAAPRELWAIRFIGRGGPRTTLDWGEATFEALEAPPHLHALAHRAAAQAAERHGLALAARPRFVIWVPDEADRVAAGRRAMAGAFAAGMALWAGFIWLADRPVPSAPSRPGPGAPKVNSARPSRMKPGPKPPVRLRKGRKRR